MPANKLRTHWATTYHGPWCIRIFRNSADSFTDKYEGTTWESSDINKPFEVDVADYVFANPVKFNEVLLHEFVHVLEAIHRKRPGMFSVKSVGDCTALAKTIGSGLGEMLTRLEQISTKPRRKRKR